MVNIASVLKKPVTVNFFFYKEKVGKLLSIPSLAHHPDLQAFLQSEKNKYLGWLQEVKTNSFIKVCYEFYN